MSHESRWTRMADKPNCSGRECINSRCRHFGLLLFPRFGSICRRYNRSYRRSERSHESRWTRMADKPNCSGRECINSRCRHFGLLLFPRFGSICRRYNRSYRRSERFRLSLFGVSLATNHDAVTAPFHGRSLVH